MEHAAAPLTGSQKTRWTLGGMVGQSAAMERLFLQMRYVAGHLRSALVEGEPGTGKRLTAETLHALGGARTGSFAGFEATHFLSGASAAALDQAGGGTLYLHGLDGLSHEQQGRLLHVLHAHGMRRPGLEPGSVAHGYAANMPRAIIFSARRALRPLVLAGKFRSDLYGRLTAVHLQMPPLRERRQDIPMLLELFLGRFAHAYGKRVAGVAPEALSLLMRHRWPGNVAELEVMVSRAVLRTKGERLQMHDLLPRFVGQSSQAAAREQGGYERHEGSTAPRSVPAVPAGLHSEQTVAAVLQAQGEQGSSFHAAASKLSCRTDAVPDGKGSAETASEPLPDAVAVASRNPDADSDPDPNLDPNLDRAILRHVLRVLAGVSGNKLQAARLLGISRSTLYRLLEGQARPVAAGNAEAVEGEPEGENADSDAE